MSGDVKIDKDGKKLTMYVDMDSMHYVRYDIKVRDIWGEMVQSNAGNNRNVSQYEHLIDILPAELDLHSIWWKFFITPLDGAEGECKLAFLLKQGDTILDDKPYSGSTTTPKILDDNISISHS